MNLKLSGIFTASYWKSDALLVVLNPDDYDNSGGKSYFATLHQLGLVVFLLTDYYEQ